MYASRHLHGTLKTVKYHGQKRETQVAVIEDSDIVITTYHTLAADFAAKASRLNEIAWFRVVLDEGRETARFNTLLAEIKNEQTKRLTCIFSSYYPPAIHRPLPDGFRIKCKVSLVPHRYPHPKPAGRHRRTLCLYPSAPF